MKSPTENGSRDQYGAALIVLLNRDTHTVVKHYAYPVLSVQLRSATDKLERVFFVGPSGSWEEVRVDI